MRLTTLVLLALPAFALQQYHPAAAISDFDNDLHPDLATASEYAGRYQVQVHLTASEPLQIFELSAKSGGLHLSPQDVDGDNDVDLVISTVLGEHVGIWLNNGHGSFSKSAALYAESIWHERSELRQAGLIVDTEELAASQDDLYQQPETRAGPVAAQVFAFTPRYAAEVPLSPVLGPHSIRPPPIF